MKKHVRTITIIAVTLLLPMLLILPITQAKRGKKSPSRPALTQPNASQASLPAKFNSLVRPQNSLTPVSGTAVNFGISQAVRDLPTPKHVEPDQNADQNLKVVPNKIIRRSTDTPVLSWRPKVDKDAAIQDSAPAPNIPGTIVNFEGQSIHDTILLGQGFLPPDTVGDVGPNHYVQAVNVTFRVYNKAGAPLTPVRSIGDLFSTIPGPCAGDESGDPVVHYDSYADRWLISQFCTVANPNNHQLIAISQTPDPTGAYFLYDFMMPNNKFNDYPKFGVWPDGYYMTDNQFNQAGTAFLGGGAFAFDRAKLLAGDPTASFIYFDLFTLDPSIGGMLPSDADGLTPPPAGAPNVFSYFIATEFGDASDGLRLFNFHADFAVPANSTFIERVESPIAVAAFNPADPAGRDDIEQPPPAINATMALDAISDRLMHRLQYRNFGTHQSLITNHTVNVGTGNTQALHQAGVRYYELRNTAGTYGVNEQASFAPDTTNRWMGSAAMDHQGNLAVGYSVSSTTVFPGVRYAGRLVGDPPNGLFQGEATMQAGGFVQVNTLSRWGDYSSMNVDPTDDCTFWYTQEYFLADEATTAEWHTRVGSFKVNPACQAQAQGTLTVNVTNCDSGLPLQGASITVNNNLQGSTIANGSFSSQLAPGTYTVSISAPNYFPVTINGVIITNGNTTTINQCILGTGPSIAAAGATITAESCVPADNALSPNETVTVAFGLKNSGTAATTNLVATLQATGGVTNPSGPQNYGALPPDNTTVVTRPFTFTVDPSKVCGDTVTATFQLQDGATNLGTVTFTLQIGATGGATATASYSTGNIAVPIPDVSSVDIPINVPDTGLVDDVNVRVRLNHTFDGDLVLILVHPDGTEITLSNRRGGGGDNFGTGANDCSGTPTIFDQQAATAISAGVAPFAGSFRPEVSLAGLNGKPTVGTWKLRVTDAAALDVGTVGCVTLEIRRLQFVCCGVAGTPDIEAGDAVLTTESCPPDNNAIDPGERVTVNLELHNTGTGATTNLVATLQATGGVQSPSNPQSYGALTPTGPGSSATRDFSFTAVGSCGSSITATWQLQDGATDLGTVTKTFVLGATVNATQTFANPAAITIPAPPSTGAATGAPAAPYPSTINVAGVMGTVSKVTVTLTNFSHTFPSDVDVLLVGPGGQRLLLMSDVGGGTDAVNTTLTFDDAAAALIGATVVSGTFRPTNIGAGDLFPAPAAAGPYPDPQLLSVFNGVNPNGSWSLYVVDDAGQDIGSISGGWSLTLTVGNQVCTTPCGIVRLVTTSNLVRTSPSNVQATITVANIGTVPAANVMLTTAALGGAPGTPLPQSLGTINPGGSVSVVVIFATASTGSSTLATGGTFTGGTFSTTARVTIP